MAYLDNKEDNYNHLLDKIISELRKWQSSTFYAINNALLVTYWNIGQYIVEFEQAGKSTAGYGKNLLINLSKDLTIRLGKGFSKSNLFNMRLFYIRFPKFQTVSGKLAWSHYLEILGIEDDMERTFYLTETENNQWSVRELRRQKESWLFYRLALSKDKKGILKLSQQGVEITRPEDIVKDTYVLEFLGLPEQSYKERDFENALISHLEEFLLELGKGFAFIARQYRLNIDNNNYYADLVFYHVILKCYVIIDLKVGKVTHQDIGQMNMYLGYFAIDKNNADDNSPIWIILWADKNDIMVEYATYGIDTNLFVSKYQLLLPNVDELKQLVQEEMGRKNN